jgi:hypothetical protein
LPSRLERTPRWHDRADVEHCTPAPDLRTLWLEVSVDGRVLPFEFAPGNERAIAVGSLREADVSIRDPRVAAVEFHFEREGRRIFVVPAYGAHIEVNAVILRGPRPIRDRAIIAFAGRAIRVCVSETPAAHGDFGNDTVIAPLAPCDAGDTPNDDVTLTLPLPLDTAPAVDTGVATTASETPLAKQKCSLPPPSYPARLEYSELLALRAALRVPDSARASSLQSLRVLVSAVLGGFLLGYLGAHAFPLSPARSPTAGSGTEIRPGSRDAR